MKLPFTIDDLRLTIERKSPPPGIAGSRAGADTNHQSSIINHQSRQGFALVITLILLSVTLIMAVAFLAISRRERGSVVTSTDTATARYAADAALASAEAQIISSALATTNPYVNNLLVSTNFINANGFYSGSSNPTNVNYAYNNGNPLNNTSPNYDFLQNIANLLYLPRVPVFVPTNALGVSDFRFYLDLNRNGKFEDSGMVTNLDNNGVGLDTTSFQMGDPQWIGVLERPDAPHGPNNKFVARYAFIALPADNTLDLNYIHNQSLHGNANTAVNPTQPGVGDVYFRNQGVGSWEINLAAFLTDLNPNEWDPPTAENTVNNNNFYQYSPPPAIGGNTGYAFDDARALLAYRYNNTFGSLNFVPTLFPNYSLSGGSVDILPLGFPLGQAMTNTAVPFYNYGLNNYLWPGADNTNHYFALFSDLFDPNKTGSGVAPAQIAANNYFTGRLLDAGVNFFGGKTNSTYDRYTFYRLLAQLGTDSSPETGKMNLNYDNLDHGLIKATHTFTGPAALTNFMAWTPLAFFTNAADRMLRLYTTNWFQAGPSNYLATYYGIYTNYYYTDVNLNIHTNDLTGIGLTNLPLFGMTNQIPAFGVTNIPVYINGRFVYASSVQRVLQLAANIYDASTNSFFPSVFRPLFEHDNFGNVFIASYTNLSSGFGPNTISGINDNQLASPYNISYLTNYFGSYQPIADAKGFVNVYGVPWIVGAKKGFPNFNEFSINNAVQITRKLQIKRANYSYPPQFSFTNEAYVFGIGSSLGIEFWNSYTNSYNRPVQIVVNETLSLALTNGDPLSPYQNAYRAFTNVTVQEWSNKAPQSFVYQLTNITFLTNQTYVWGGGFTSPDAAYWQTNIVNLPQLPQFGLLTTNRLQTFILDGNHVIDYAHFAGPDSSRNLNAEIQSNLGNQASYLNMWTTNLQTLGAASGVPIAIANQINAAKDSAAIPLNSLYWKNPPAAAEIDGFWVFMGGSAGAIPLPLIGQAATNAFEGYLTNLIHQVPYSPTVTAYEYTTWQANDPLVHYLGSDLNFSETDVNPPTGLSKTYLATTNFFGTLANIGSLNHRYAPWGAVHKFAGSDNNPYNFAYKDPGVTNSDAWAFPVNKYPTVGWLGRVHRGTPWQTVFLKATNILNLTPTQLNGAANGLTTWTNWTGNRNAFDAINARPTDDFLLFDIFNTAVNDNATRGRLSINVAANTNNPAAGLAAWSALFSGMAVPTSLTNFTMINPAGTFGAPVPAGPPASPNSPFCLGYLVQNGTNGINDVRANFKNPDGLVGAFEHVGNILAVPALTEQSPFLAGQNLATGVNDAMMEWLPQQTLSLLRASTAPRYVIYCYGQTLKPAPNGVVTSGGAAYFGMVTNYQVVAETATRAVVQFHPVVVTNNAVTPPQVQTNYSATLEQFNPLPPD